MQCEAVDAMRADDADGPMIPGVDRGMRGKFHPGMMAEGRLSAYIPTCHAMPCSHAKMSVVKKV